MDFNERILGKGIVRKLNANRTAYLLKIGSDTFTRGDLSAVECYNFAAAANLNQILSSPVLRVRNTQDLFNRVNPSLLALPGLGAVSLAVLSAAFEAKGIGGAVPLEAWFKHHDLKVVGFVTVKHRALKELSEQRREQRAAERRQRRNSAQGENG